MLCLRGPHGECHNLLMRAEHMIGRGDASLEIKDNKSVSRVHAMISVRAKSKRVVVYLQDRNSKYGTYLNDKIQKLERIAPQNDIELTYGDRILFGMENQIWTLEKDELKVCSSTLTACEKMTLNSALTKLGAHFVDEWSDRCYYLTANKLRLTMKVILALAEAKPIVTVDYWKCLADAFTSKTEKAVPDYDQYLPPLDEPTLSRKNVNFLPDVGRSRLFKDYTFVATSDNQYDSMKDVIRAAGGTIVNCNAQEVSEELLYSSKTVVLRNTGKTAAVSEILAKLKLKKLGTIPECDVGLAILHISTDRYCNPSVGATDVPEIANDRRIATGTDESILALDTERSDLMDVEETEIVIDETASPVSTFTVSSDRKRRLEHRGQGNPSAVKKKIVDDGEEFESKCSVSMIGSDAAQIDESFSKDDEIFANLDVDSIVLDDKNKETGAAGGGRASMSFEMSENASDASGCLFSTQSSTLSASSSNRRPNIFSNSGVCAEDSNHLIGGVRKECRKQRKITDLFAQPEEKSSASSSRGVSSVASDACSNLFSLPKLTDQIQKTNLLGNQTSNSSSNAGHLDNQERVICNPQRSDTQNSEPLVITGSFIPINKDASEDDLELSEGVKKLKEMSVALVAPLVRKNKQNGALTKLREDIRGLPNFKKFKKVGSASKNDHYTISRVISSESLVEYEPKMTDLFDKKPSSRKRRLIYDNSDDEMVF